MDDEVVKLKFAQDFLKEGGVVDIDSFYEKKMTYNDKQRKFQGISF